MISFLIAMKEHSNSQQEKSGLIKLGPKLLNKFNQRGPVSQDLKLIKFASEPEQPGLSSSISLKAMCIRTQSPMKSDSLNQPNLEKEI